MAISVVGQYPKFRAYDPTTKLPLVGGKLYCYAIGTTTNKAIYTTYARTIEVANPVVLDANGESLFYLNGMYDLVLKDSAGVTVWTVANYNDQPVSATVSTTAPTTEGSPVNPSFEYEGTTAGLPSNWTIFKWNTVVLDTAVSSSGTNSLKFISPGGASGVSGGGTATSEANFTTRPGAVISVGVTLKSSVATVHNQVQLLEYNSALALVATTTIYDDATTNPATFTAFWKTVTLGASTAWAKIYIVGAKNDSSTAGTTWVDSIEIKQGSVGGHLSIVDGTTSGTIRATAATIRITAPGFVVDSAAGNTQTSVTATLSGSTTVDVLAGTVLTLQGSTLTINGLVSTVVTTPSLTLATPVLAITANTSTTLTSPVLSITAATSTGLTSPALTLTSSTSITIVTPLITSVLGLVVGAATGGAKGDGTINAVGLYVGGVAPLFNGTNALSSALALNGQNVSTDGILYAYTNRAAVAAVAASATVQVVAHGRVNGATGAIINGQGYTSVRNSAGNYTLTWTTAFSAVPAVLASDPSTGAKAVVTATTTTATVVLTDTADFTFSFIAVGAK